MRKVDCVQGSPEWVAARLGIPTASRFDEIITPAKREPSKSMDKYVAELLAEWMLGMPLDKDGSALMDRGSELEEKAAQYYEIETGLTTEKIGFCLTDDGLVGASPDRLVFGGGLAEFKCPAPQNHIYYLLNGIDAKYRCQLQGQLWVAEKPWVDLVSYHPDMPAYRERVERDDQFIADLRVAMYDHFLPMLESGKRRLMELGAVPETVAA